VGQPGEPRFLPAVDLVPQTSTHRALTSSGHRFKHVLQREVSLPGCQVLRLGFPLRQRCPGCLLLLLLLLLGMAHSMDHFNMWRWAGFSGERDVAFWLPREVGKVTASMLGGIFPLERRNRPLDLFRGRGAVDRILGVGRGQRGRVLAYVCLGRGKDKDGDR